MDILLCSAGLRLHLEYTVLSFGPLTSRSYKEWVRKQDVFSPKIWRLRRDLISLNNYLKGCFSRWRPVSFIMPTMKGQWEMVLTWGGRFRLDTGKKFSLCEWSGIGIGCPGRWCSHNPSRQTPGPDRVMRLMVPVAVLGGWLESSWKFLWVLIILLFCLRQRQLLHY